MIKRYFVDKLSDVKKDNQYYDRSYDSYGEYAKDFSSPDIMAILTKRRKP